MGARRADGLGLRPGAVSLTAGLVLAVSACGGSSGGRPSGADRPSSPGSGAAVPIAIRTRVDLPTGTVLSGSTVEGQPFCSGGRFTDEHGTSGLGLVERTITCTDGTLRIGMDPMHPVGSTQSGAWRIGSGSGAYQGWRGGGSMTITYDASDTSEHPTRGTESFTGTVSR